MSQNAKISNLARSVLRPTLPWMTWDDFSAMNRSGITACVPAATRGHCVRKCKISIISGFPQAMGRGHDRDRTAFAEALGRGRSPTICAIERGRACYGIPAAAPLGPGERSPGRAYPAALSQARIWLVCRRTSAGKAIDWLRWVARSGLSGLFPPVRRNRMGAGRGRLGPRPGDRRCQGGRGLRVRRARTRQPGVVHRSCQCEIDTRDGKNRDEPGSGRGFRSSESAGRAPTTPARSVPAAQPQRHQEWELRIQKFTVETLLAEGHAENCCPSTFEAECGYFFAAVAFAAASAYFFVKRSTRPAVSISFCLPVKKGWQLEQISTRSMSPLMVERVGNVLPQAQCTVTC